MRKRQEIYFEKTLAELNRFQTELHQGSDDKHDRGRDVEATDAGRHGESRRCRRAGVILIRRFFLFSLAKKPDKLLYLS
jgi:hypothetical protein